MQKKTYKFRFIKRIYIKNNHTVFFIQRRYLFGWETIQCPRTGGFLQNKKKIKLIDEALRNKNTSTEFADVQLYPTIKEYRYE
jgi:hypothetical protein